jgi:hypothetical protein
MALAVAAVVLTVLAATYQPVSYGSWSGLSLVPGMPHAKGVRWVNKFGASGGDFYVPPQQGTFTISASITNDGAHAVIIEGVSLWRADGPGPYIGLPVPARYYLVKGGQPAVHLLRNVTLRPGDEMVIGIPCAPPCASTLTWTTIDSFLVRERFRGSPPLTVPFTPKGGYLIMHSRAATRASRTWSAPARNRVRARLTGCAMMPV